MSLRSFLIDQLLIKQPRIRSLATRLAYGGGVRVIELLGLTLVVDALKENGYLRASQKAAHSSVFRDEVSVLLNLASLVTHDTVFLDIGANIGLYASTIARLSRLKPGLRVLAFEVNPDTFARLQRNAERYGFQALCVGVGDRESELRFVEGAVSHVTTTSEHSNRYNIPSRTFMQKVLPLSKIDIPAGELGLKIDVEGQEYAVLVGARPFFENARVSFVYVDGYADARVPAFLKEFGFAFFDGRTLERVDEQPGFSLLAVREKGATSAAAQAGS